MPVGDVRRNQQTGDTYRLEQVGNNLEWVEQGDDNALRAAQVGPVGAALSGLSQTISLGTAVPEGLSEAQQQQFPVASRLGQFAPDIAALGTMAGTSLAGRVAQRITQSGVQQAAKATAERQLLRRPSNMLGRATATGSAARLIEGGAEAVPGLNIPGLLQKAVNQRRINESFARSMGLSDEVATKARLGVNDIQSDVLHMFDEGYASIRNSVGKGMNQADARAVIDLAGEKGYIGNNLHNVVSQGKLTGDDLMSVRSELSKLARSNENYRVIRDAEEHIAAIDDIIEAALKRSGDDVSMQQFKVLNGRYAVWRNVRKGRGIGADGQLMPRAIDGRLRAPGGFGDRYAAGELKMPSEELDSFLAIIREGAELEVGLPSSGTAERAALGALLLGGGSAVAGQ